MVESAPPRCHVQDWDRRAPVGMQEGQMACNKRMVQEHDLNCLRYAQAAYKELTKGQDLFPDGLKLRCLVEPREGYMKGALLQFIYLFLEDRHVGLVREDAR